MFAAGGSIAHERGGKWTRAFLENLPADWRDEHLVVDSFLVWLQAGQSLASQWFHHEVFPGNNDRAYGAANAEREVEHIACALGAPSARDFLIGDLTPLTTASSADFYRLDGDDLPLRHERLRNARDVGELRSVIIGLGALHRYGWSTFQRTLPTATPGFHFYIRATRGSRRTIVNGRRNVVSPSLTGPWSATPPS